VKVVAYEIYRVIEYRNLTKWNWLLLEKRR